ncbi:hypothetical protein [Streptococcus equinus]|uniref:hypothetical protein n=1 Tax=Streptococcus equinus TaxID=1335 RepID=UPI001156898E|nr:hypothetical protein [Streptococcus equinus]
MKNIIKVLHSSIVIGTLYYIGMLGVAFAALYYYFIEDKQLTNKTLMIIGFISFLLVFVAVVLAKISSVEENNFLETSMMNRITAIFSFAVVLILLILILFF